MAIAAGVSICDAGVYFGKKALNLGAYVGDTYVGRKTYDASAFALVKAATALFGVGSAGAYVGSKIVPLFWGERKKPNESTKEASQSQHLNPLHPASITSNLTTTEKTHNVPPPYTKSPTTKYTRKHYGP